MSFVTILCLSVMSTSFYSIDEPVDELKELLPGVYVSDGVVEFDGKISIDCHHPDTPDVYLEMLVTAPDSREHESLVVSSIAGSSLHAALLAAGFESGSPITRNKDGKLLHAHGEKLSILIAVQSDDENENTTQDFFPIEQWVTHVENKSSLNNSTNWEGLVFAGSIFREFGYAADANGTLISLTNFGDEVIAPKWAVSSSADVDEPVWIADRSKVGQLGDHIRIRIVAQPQDDSLESIQLEVRPIDKSHEPDRIDIDRDL